MNNNSSAVRSPTEVFHNASEHNVQLYADDRHLIDMAGQYIGRALSAGARGIVVATQNHRDELSKRLLAQGFDLASLATKAQYMMFDAAELLSLFMAGGHIDERLFASGAKAVFERVNQFGDGGTSRICIFGEMVALLWAAGKLEDAILFERLWNQLAVSHTFTLLCAYPIMGFYSESDLELFLRICGEHSRISLSGKLYLDTDPESFTRFPPDDRASQKDLICHETHLRFQLLIKALKERSVFMTDLEGKIRTWNSGAESMYGYAAREVLGRHVSFLDNEEDNPDNRYKVRLATALQEGSFEERYWRTRKNGSRFFATFTITPAKNESGKIVGFAEATCL
jgi:PAS domain S-box-containing protein